MALKSTIFRATLNVSDLDRGHFADEAYFLTVLGSGNVGYNRVPVVGLECNLSN